MSFGNNLDQKLAFRNMREQELVMKFHHIVLSEVHPPCPQFYSFVLLLNGSLADNFPDATRGSVQVNMLLEESLIALCKRSGNLLQCIGKHLRHPFDELRRLGWYLWFTSLGYLETACFLRLNFTPLPGIL